MYSFHKKCLATLAICATAAPLSVFATPLLNAEFGYSGTGITQFTSGGNTYLNGANNAPGINTATTITIQNPFVITSTANSYNGLANDFNGIFTNFLSRGYIVNSALNSTYTLGVPQGGGINLLSGIHGPFASITANNGDTYDFVASKDYVGGTSAGVTQSSLTINVLGAISDSQKNYLTTPASFQLIVSDTGGGLSFAGTFGAPPAVANVPEPAPLLLIGLGVLCMGLATRKYRLGRKDMIAA